MVDLNIRYLCWRNHEVPTNWGTRHLAYATKLLSPNKKEKTSIRLIYQVNAAKIECGLSYILSYFLVRTKYFPFLWASYSVKFKRATYFVSNKIDFKMHVYGLKERSANSSDNRLCDLVYVNRGVSLVAPNQGLIRSMKSWFRKSQPTL